MTAVSGEIGRVRPRAWMGGSKRMTHGGSKLVRSTTTLRPYQSQYMRWIESAVCWAWSGVGSRAGRVVLLSSTTDLSESCADLLLHQPPIALEVILVASQPSEILLEAVGERALCGCDPRGNGQLERRRKHSSSRSSPCPIQSARRERAASEGVATRLRSRPRSRTMARVGSYERLWRQTWVVMAEREESRSVEAPKS